MIANELDRDKTSALIKALSAQQTTLETFMVHCCDISGQELLTQLGCEGFTDLKQLAIGTFRAAGHADLVTEGVVSTPVKFYEDD